MTYGHIALALNSDNYIKAIEAAKSAKPTIMQPPESLTPPPPRPGYRPVVLPTWCSVGQVCDGVVSNEYQRRMGKDMPPQQRADTIRDRSIARLR